MTRNYLWLHRLHTTGKEERLLTLLHIPCFLLSFNSWQNFHIEWLFFGWSNGQKLFKNTLKLDFIPYFQRSTFAKSKTPPWVLFTFFKLNKWYQITQRISHIHLEMRRSIEWFHMMRKLVANSFYSTNVLLYLLETSENQKFSDFFRGV